jgi:HAD superfamily hydrolase (TIGR01509 family)
MNVKGAIFDMDGTLVDTNQAHVEAWHKAFHQHGHEIPEERIRPEIGKGGDQLVPAILGEALERKQGKALREAHDRAFLDIASQRHFAVFAGALALLDALRGRGVKVALATSSKKKFVEATQKSAKVDFAAHADVTITADDADASKPAPDLVLAALQKLDLPTAECIFIGDTVHDVEAAKKAGVACLGVACGGCASASELRSAGARSVWRDPADLLQHLDEILSSRAPGA